MREEWYNIKRGNFYFGKSGNFYFGLTGDFNGLIEGGRRLVRPQEDIFNASFG
jgi:hypothetical protein